MSVAESIVVKSPLEPGWVQSNLLDSIMQLKNQAIAEGHYGMYVVMLSAGWKRQLHRPYRYGPKQLAMNLTLCERIKQLDGVVGVRVVDHKGYGAAIAQIVVQTLDTEV